MFLVISHQNVNSHALDTFSDLFRKDLQGLRTRRDFSKFRHPNMTRGALQALRELTHNHDLTIKPADMGGGVMVMDTSQYIIEARRQLADCDIYRSLSIDPRWAFEKLIQTLVDKAFQDGLIDSDLKGFSIGEEPSSSSAVSFT